TSRKTLTLGSKLTSVKLASVLEASTPTRGTFPTGCAPAACSAARSPRAIKPTTRRLPSGIMGSVPALKLDLEDPEVRAALGAHDVLNREAEGHAVGRDRSQIPATDDPALAAGRAGAHRVAEVEAEGDVRVRRRAELHGSPHDWRQAGEF